MCHRHKYRPVRQFLSGSTRPVAACGLESYEDLIRPICPHASNGFRENCEMHVRRKTRNHKVTWVFQASHEGCDFIGMHHYLRCSILDINHQYLVHIPDFPRENLILRDLGMSHFFFILKSAHWTPGLRGNHNRNRNGRRFAPSQSNVNTTSNSSSSSSLVTG
jgi:hypothetical protein